MQQRIIYKSIIGCWMLSLFASVSTAVAVEYSNPWALPQASMDKDWRQTDKQHDIKQSSPSPAPQSKTWRFVTPEILDSLKQQQMQMQLMPGQIVPQQQRVEPSGSCPVVPKKPTLLPQFVSGSGLMPQSSYFSGQSAMPSRMPSRLPAQMPSVAPSDMHFGMNNTNPMFDSPAVSPWGEGADVLYRGESFPNSFPGSVPSALEGEFPGNTQRDYPWVPNEALGGLLPIPVSPSVADSYKRERAGIMGHKSPAINEKTKVDNVFNPFTFLPRDSLK